MRPVSGEIFSLEVLTVDGHVKRGSYVSSHLHLNVTYLLEADEEEGLHVREGGNSGVQWFGLDEAVQVSQFFSILEADRLEGPYNYVHKVNKPLKMDSGDYTREAPTFFERDGKKYLFTSGTSGYYPNPSRVCMFDDYHGEYVDLGDPCIGDKSGTTFNSQITSVLKVAGKDLYIACADRWNPQWWVPKLSRQIIKGMERHFADYKPDTSPKEEHPLPGVETRHKENTSIARYVWLPIDWHGDKPTIHWRNEWKWEEYCSEQTSDYSRAEREPGYPPTQNSEMASCE